MLSAVSVALQHAPIISRQPAQPQSDSAGLITLFCVSTAQRLEAKATLFYEGDPARHLFQVVEGVVKLYKLTPDGRRQITGFMYPGQLLGLAFNDTYVQTAETVTTAQLCRYPRSRLESLAEEHPKLARWLLSATTNELIAAQDQMLLLGRKSATEKIASFLMRLWHGNVERGVPGEDIDLPMSRMDIADYLGLTTETVSRTLGRLQERRTIEVRQHRHIHLSQPDVLESMAEGETGDCFA